MCGSAAADRPISTAHKPRARAGANAQYFSRPARKAAMACRRKHVELFFEQEALSYKTRFPAPMLAKALGTHDGATSEPTHRS